MDYPKSVPSIGLVGGKFADEDPLSGTPGSLIPSQWGNGVTDELLNVITAAGLVPDELLNTQLLTALKIVTPGRLIGVQVFAAAGSSVYTETPGTKSVVVEVVGGGGGSGGVAATTASQCAASSGGAYGAYGKGRFTAAFSGVTITVGAGGAAASAGANNGGVGGSSSFGALLAAPGGPGGVGGVANSGAAVPTLGSGPSASPSGANIFGSKGQSSGYGMTFTNVAFIPSAGGSGPFGAGGEQPNTPGAKPGSGYGSGAGGTYNPASSAAQPGGAGRLGLVIVWEYA